MVLVVLAVIWGIVLVPPFLRSRAESRPGDSIVGFRRQLGVLERTAPLTIPAAHRLDGMARVRMAPMHQANPAHAAHYGPVTGVAPGHSFSPPRNTALRRRREVFKALLVAMAGTLVLGALPALRGLWAVHVVVDLAFVGYVVLLVRMRNAAAERAMKVHVIPRANQDLLAALRTPEPVFATARASGE